MPHLNRFSRLAVQCNRQVEMNTFLPENAK
jgi:predicted N-formylglutamate amidohydrolase